MHALGGYGLQEVLNFGEVEFSFFLGLSQFSPALSRER